MSRFAISPTTPSQPVGPWVALPPVEVPILEPVELAYLLGGQRRALHTTLRTLERRGCIAVREVSGDHLAVAWQTPEGLDPVAARVMAALPPFDGSPVRVWEIVEALENADALAELEASMHARGIRETKAPDAFTAWALLASALVPFAVAALLPTGPSLVPFLFGLASLWGLVPSTRTTPLGAIAIEWAGQRLRDSWEMAIAFDPEAPKWLERPCWE
jgi:uncharacterized protein (TIGR04222 family)